MNKLPNKDPIEKVLVTFDYADSVKDILENILSSVWEIELKSGADASPSSMLDITTNSTTKTTATHMISGGVNGCIYLVTCTVTTSLGQVIKHSAQLKVLIQGH
jgi:hypothetical protein